MKAYFVKQLNGSLLPAYDEDKEQLKKIKIGEVIEMEYKKPRNLKFHKMYFALLNMVIQNQEKFSEVNELRYWLTMKAGYFTMVHTSNGVVYIPKSISFASMDETEFKDLFDKSVQVIEQEFGWENEMILNNLNDFM